MRLSTPLSTCSTGGAPRVIRGRAAKAPPLKSLGL